MREYNKFQTGWFMIMSFGIILIMITLSYYYQWGNNPIDKLNFIIMISLFSAIILLFYGMRTVVTEETINVVFGIGLIRFKFKTQDVYSVHVVQNPWYFGLGIRVIPNGMLYNIQGRKAIQLKFSHKSTIVSIGTADPEALKSAIIEKLDKKHHHE